MKKTTNTYEASYYLLYGATLEKTTKRQLSKKKALDKGYPIEYTFYLSNVPKWAKESWRAGYVYANVVEFSKMRQYLKKEMRNA